MAELDIHHTRGMSMQGTWLHRYTPCTGQAIVDNLAYPAAMGLAQARDPL